MKATLFTRIFILYAAIASSLSCVAQAGFYIPDSGSVMFFSSGSTIFSNVTNNGIFGLSEKSGIFFSGGTWINSPSSKILNADPVNPYGSIFFVGDSWTDAQYLDGGYNDSLGTGPVFPNIMLRNKSGLALIRTATKISNELALQEGLLTLNESKLIIGNVLPGMITGYDSTRFIITNNTAGGGLLIRENISCSDSTIIFPIGVSAGSYTPLALQKITGVSNPYSAGIMDSAYQHAAWGASAQSKGVNKTWYVRMPARVSGRTKKPLPRDKISITLQHYLRDEGKAFHQQRRNTYVSAYVAAGKWDVGYPQYYPFPGDLTSGETDSLSGVNTRVFSNLEGGVYLTKLTGTGELHKTALRFSGIRENESFVQLGWKTSAEIFNRYFIVQRRLFNEPAFHNVDTVASKIAAQYNFSGGSYALNDHNSYHGQSFYRLMLAGCYGEISYSETVTVNGIMAQDHITIWPNPAHGFFNIGFSEGMQIAKAIIYDLSGNLVREIVLTGENTTRVEIRPGTYIVRCIAPDGSTAGNRKVIVW